MFLGRVAGTVWSTVKWPQAVGIKLLLVRPYRLGDFLRASPAAAGQPGAPRPSRPTTWSSAPTRWTPGRATT